MCMSVLPRAVVGSAVEVCDCYFSRHKLMPVIGPVLNDSVVIPSCALLNQTGSSFSGHTVRLAISGLFVFLAHAAASNAVM